MYDLYRCYKERQLAELLAPKLELLLVGKKRLPFKYQVDRRGNLFRSEWFATRVAAPLS